MNATSLYVSTCRLIIQADAKDQTTWSDLYRLVPYLRQSMSCSVCGNLLKEPFTPTDTSCQHHVCRKCKGGRKKLKPACSWCKDYHKYVENCQLRILIQCYKQLCEYLISTDIFKKVVELARDSSNAGESTTASTSLADLIQEGAGYSDDYKSTEGLSKSAYSVLPCVYTNSSTQTQCAIATTSTMESHTPNRDSPPIKTLSNGSSLYSVMYPGTGNKITIKRKAIEDTIKKEPLSNDTASDETSTNFKKPVYRSRNSASKRKGCRCGNATATPGKLTCCGQRCPCYVDSKACSECKCKGCRNPHREDGLKVRPHLPLFDNYELSIPLKQELSPTDLLESLEDSLDMSTMEQTLTFEADIKPHINVYTSQLQEVSASLPAAIMMDEDISPSSPASGSDSISSDLERSSIQASNDSMLTPQFNSLIAYQSSQLDNASADVEIDL